MQLQMGNIRYITTITITLGYRILRLQVNTLPGQHPHHPIIISLNRVAIFIIFNQIFNIFFIFLEIIVIGRYRFILMDRRILLEV